jgi:hypothetical protein
MTDSDAPRKAVPFTLDEVISIVSEIARDESDRDRFKALKMLTSLNQSVAAIPPPLNDDEVVERLMRLMKGSGPKLCRKAYRKAYPLTDRTPTFDKEELEDLGVFIKSKIKGLKTLKQYNRMFPEVAKGGVPPGYPSGAGPEAQMEWVQRAATKIFVERRRLEVAKEAAAVKSEEAISQSGYEEDDPDAA